MGMDFELVEITKREEIKGELEAGKLLEGVRHLCDSGITRVPRNYILPVPDRPGKERCTGGSRKLKLPVIDLSRLRTSDRAEVLRTLANACEEYGFFQVVNHGIDSELISRMVDVGRRFFELAFEERRKYMSSDIRAPVRCGTSLNQVKDRVFFWRDFLKLNCHPLESMLQHWPSSPLDLRDKATSYVKQVKSLFLVLVGAILETLRLDKEIVRRFDDGTHMMVINCYPACPEPNLTLGMPPHSDYGFLTLLLQDDVHGLQVQCKGEWVTVEPVPNSFVVNAGDHLEIFSNGRYKSVLHRVLVNSSKSRISIASLLSLPFDSVVNPSPELVDDENPRLYKDTDFASFLDFITFYETNQKNFLETRRLTKNTENVKS